MRLTAWTVLAVLGGCSGEPRPKSPVDEALGSDSGTGPVDEVPTDEALLRAAIDGALDPTEALQTIARQGGFPIESTTGSFLFCLLYTSPSPRDRTRSRMPSSA